MRTTKVRTVIAAAAVAASLGLTGCSVDFNTGSDDKKETSEQSEQNDSSGSSGSSGSGSGEAASQSDEDTDTADSEDSGSGSEAAASGDVLAEVEVPAKQRPRMAMLIPVMPRIPAAVRKPSNRGML